jgi:ATP-dependent Clp protease, protease subunit
MEQPVIIKFFAPLVDVSVNALMQAIEQKMQEGKKQFVLLLSIQGGTTFHSISAYNYLQGLPIQLTTHNFGTLDPLGMILYCCGKKRLVAPMAQFNFTGVTAAFKQQETLELRQLSERLKNMQDEQLHISRILSFNIGKTIPEIQQAMEQGLKLDAEQAVAWNLATAVQPMLFDSGSEVISIQAQAQKLG